MSRNRIPRLRPPSARELCGFVSMHDCTCPPRPELGERFEKCVPCRARAYRLDDAQRWLRKVERNGDRVNLRAAHVLVEHAQDAIRWADERAAARADAEETIG